MYICTCIHTYECIYLSTYVSKYLCMQVTMFKWMYRLIWPALEYGQGDEHEPFGSNSKVDLQTRHTWGPLLLFLFTWLYVIMLLNILIAMLSSTYEVQGRMDSCTRTHSPHRHTQFMQGVRSTASTQFKKHNVLRIVEMRTIPRVFAGALLAPRAFKRLYLRHSLCYSALTGDCVNLHTTVRTLHVRSVSPHITWQ